MSVRRPAVVGALVGALVLAAGCGSGAPTVDAATAKAEITHAYGTLFDFTDKSVPAKTAVIEHGATLTQALTDALGSSLAASATGARVDAVQVLRAAGCTQAALTSPCAKVSYDILGPGGTPLFPTRSSGYAVQVGGHWLVAKTTICGLLGLFYSASGRSGSPPGC